MPTDFFAQLEQLLSDSTDDAKLNSPVQVLQEVGTPSASIAILENGKITSHCISAVGDNTETLFQACSISKATAGVGVMRLVEEGLFKVEDQIRGLLPADIVELLSEDPRTRAAFDSITVAQLMSHTSGLSVSYFPGYPYGTDVPDVHTLLRGREPSTTMQIRLCSLPGAEFIYSGGGITIVQCIMEHVTKLSFAEVMKKYVFEPLDMTRSMFILPNDEKNVTRCFWQGYRQCEVRWHYQPESAAAGLWTTPTDLMKLVKGVQDSLRGHGILEQVTAKTMLTRVTKEIALTWFVTSTGFCHTGGNFPGFRCFATGYTDLSWNRKPGEVAGSLPEGCGIAIMTNSEKGISTVFRLMYAIAYLKGWPIPGNGAGGSNAFAPFRAPRQLDIDVRWKEWIGAWQKWQIDQDKDGKPVVGVSKDVKLQLKPAAVPAEDYGEHGRSVDLVIDGTDLMLRLGWKDGSKVVEFWNGPLMSIETLKASEKEVDSA